ncbi:hypothetical protein B0I37DRAFT_408991 [Chaetomium sp. MPI-CAGE-AT-0009]|nr:hypothetical protein B0I37DRAFT_408991 [Chaetomium sp. MPI-CAGE-AT-0009]
MDRDALKTSPISASGLPGILRLTPECRQRIYVHLGLAYRFYFRTPRPAVYDLGDPSSFAQAGSPDEEFQTFHGLLLSCRTLYAEASALLYSSNRFLVHYQPPHYSLLAPLRALTPHAVRHLTHLKVVLNQASCHGRDPGNNGHGGCCLGRSWSRPQCVQHGAWYEHDLPLDAANTAVIGALADEWSSTAAYLASHLATNPGRLELALVCDMQAGDAGTAERVVLGCVGNRIRCSNSSRWKRPGESDDDSNNRSIVPPPIQEQAQPSHSPPEIRLRILEYTDLVAPFCELYWSRNTRRLTFHRGRYSCNYLWGGYCPPAFHHGCQFLQCYEQPRMGQTVGCFCRLRHAAASSSSSFPSCLCRCWGGPPTALFLVCRALSDEALRVWPRLPARPLRGKRVSARRPPTSLQGLPPQPRAGVFAPFTHDNRPRRAGHPAFADWRELIGVWMKRNLNLGGLTLRLVATQNPEAEGMEGCEIMATRAQGREVLDVYNTLLHPLRELACAEDSPSTTATGGSSDTSNNHGVPLARFYADLAWPAVRTGADWAPHEWFDAKDRELRRRAERFVMGGRYRDEDADGGADGDELKV